MGSHWWKLKATNPVKTTKNLPTHKMLYSAILLLLIVMYFDVWSCIKLKKLTTEAKVAPNYNSTTIVISFQATSYCFSPWNQSIPSNKGILVLWEVTGKIKSNQSVSFLLLWTQKGNHKSMPAWSCEKTSYSYSYRKRGHFITVCTIV
jgi:hypothetical protein